MSLLSSLRPAVWVISEMRIKWKYEKLIQNILHLTYYPHFKLNIILVLWLVQSVTALKEVNIAHKKKRSLLASLLSCFHEITVNFLNILYIETDLHRILIFLCMNICVYKPQNLLLNYLLWILHKLSSDSLALVLQINRIILLHHCIVSQYLDKKHSDLLSRGRWRAENLMKRNYLFP